MTGEADLAAVEDRRAQLVYCSFRIIAVFKYAYNCRSGGVGHSILPFNV
jgi:hypothetical protein